eukprot:1036179-Rhodomonas_salina.5
MLTRHHVVLASRCSGWRKRANATGCVRCNLKRRAAILQRDALLCSADGEPRLRECLDSDPRVRRRTDQTG